MTNIAPGPGLVQQGEDKLVPDNNAARKIVVMPRQSNINFGWLAILRSVPNPCRFDSCLCSYSVGTERHLDACTVRDLFFLSLVWLAQFQVPSPPGLDNQATSFNLSNLELFSGLHSI